MNRHSTMIFRRIFKSRNGNDRSRKERALVFKIDWFILSYCCVSFFINYLDRSSINNAYLSGMKEDLKMYGNELQDINVVFTCGYIIGQIPGSYALQKVPARLWFSVMNLIWGIMTILSFTVHSVPSMMALRFFMAIAEASTFAGTHYILGAWYKGSEIYKRAAIFSISGLIGTMFAGYLQTAVHSSLDGICGMAGWRWLFIIDGLLTIPLAFYGYFLFPDVPQTTKAPYFTEEEKQLAIKRLPDIPKKKPITINSLKTILRSWRIYGLSILWLFSGETQAIAVNVLMGQWMKASKEFTVAQINNYPTVITAVGVVSTLGASILSDKLSGRTRWPFGLFLFIVTLISASILLAWNVPYGLKLFAYFLSGCTYAGQAVWFSWANDVCRDNDQERGVVVFTMNMVQNVWHIWWAPVMYPNTDAPRFIKGYIALLVVGGFTLLSSCIVSFMQMRDKRIKRVQQDAKEEQSSTSVDMTEDNAIKIDSLEASKGSKTFTEDDSVLKAPNIVLTRQKILKPDEI
ncbi:pantothenate transporter [Schizosaccharomyces cryophilus OY26]|uniref:Pantothenate transporter n=1 Tax=Schizosaccharomyces cryophilus (strain OY26 / ATCC MYA-4695 / CBS 11777 / NBRC 106824 / NRRL Y48691) TaxID=653667 RepID=S9X9N8_SCHCR|nr:pantothenate transporter [Schizosaccharomyces cryophilus OY26]EPY50476.1 pantothenate transporter [Schizosaccharomyces cryophilus OY26]